jgi:hypothetical protein
MPSEVPLRKLLHIPGSYANKWILVAVSPQRVNKRVTSLNVRMLYCLYIKSWRMIGTKKVQHTAIGLLVAVTCYCASESS